MPITANNPFNGVIFRGAVILVSARWYFRYPLSYEHVAEQSCPDSLQTAAMFAKSNSVVNWDLYTDFLDHIHPSGVNCVEIVAHLRTDGDYDVYVHEPRGSLPPEFEAARVDDDHVYIASIEEEEDLEFAAQDIERRLGPDYQIALYYREVGSRRIIGKITSHLSKHGALHMWVRSAGNEDWELCIRRKDFRLASEVVESNV